MTLAGVRVEGGTPRTASVWATSITLSSSNPVVLALASSAATIPTTAPSTKIPKAVLRSFPETTSTAPLITERQDLSRSRFLRGLSFHWTLFNSRYYVLMDPHIPAVNGNDFYFFNIFRFWLHEVVDLRRFPSSRAIGLTGS